MASGTPNTVSLDDLTEIAERIEQELGCVAQRVALAGALRRKELAQEIEFITLPFVSSADLFGSAEPDTRAISDQISTWGQTRRRSDGAFVCQHSARVTSGRQMDVMIVVHPMSLESQWGVASVYHTGPAAFFREIAEDLARSGFLLNEAKHSLCTAQGEPVEVPDEETLFRFAGRDYCLPDQRWQEVRSGVTMQPANVGGAERKERYHGSAHQGRGMPIERD
jgi:hypothetical protein